MNILPSFNYSDEYNMSDKDYPGCPSNIYFDNTSYTLSFGHLFSGNLHCYQSLNQYYESCSFELPENYSNSLNIPLQIVNIQSMKNLRKNIKKVEKQYNYSIPSVPYCYNPIMTTCNQNKITNAVILLERAANAIDRIKNVYF